MYRRVTADVDRGLGYLDTWAETVGPYAARAVDTIADHADAVVGLLAKLVEYPVEQEQQIGRLHEAAECAAIVLGEPAPPPLPPSHATAKLDEALAALMARLRADILAAARANTAAGQSGADTRPEEID